MRNITLTDEQWTKILAFLRTCSGIYIGPEDECRRFVEGVLWMLRSGAQWRLLPAEYGNWNSIYKRFARWCEHDVWEQMMAYFADDLDLENVMLDGTIVRAHPCAAGATKKRRSRGASAGAESGRL